MRAPFRHLLPLLLLAPPLPSPAAPATDPGSPPAPEWAPDEVVVKLASASASPQPTIPERAQRPDAAGLIGLQLSF